LFTFYWFKRSQPTGEELPRSINDLPSLPTSLKLCRIKKLWQMRKNFWGGKGKGMRLNLRFEIEDFLGFEEFL